MRATVILTGAGRGVPVTTALLLLGVSLKRSFTEYLDSKMRTKTLRQGQCSR